MQQNSRVIYVLIPCLFKWFAIITCSTSNVCMFIDRQLSGLYEGHRLFNLYMCWNHFSYIKEICRCLCCWYTVPTCYFNMLPKLVSFTSLMLVSYGSCNTIFMIANIQVCRIQLKLRWHNRYVFRNFLVYLVCCCNLLL